MKLALDIGGTYIRWEVEGTAKGKRRVDEIKLESFISSLIKQYHIEAMAISYAGQVYQNQILSAPNIHANFDPARYNIPYVIENDLKCAVLAEARYFQIDSITTLYSGTGLGSATLEKGEVIRGFRNLAGEIGHIPYKSAPFRCGCGKDNCIELFASGSGLEKWARYFDIEASLENRRLRNLYVEALLHAVATILALFNPNFLILGGGVIKHNPDLIESIKEKIDEYAPPFSLEGVETHLSRLEEPSLEGAKILLERFA